ncbi:MAG: cob(I)yrinic acid a,c-diamide adenosyltransferase [Porphyromonadaceae bacterium]|nr:cob(I)yrinic acid a,c-diamide adenosyltransferase [Porphyromonadaceae bacterium]
MKIYTKSGDKGTTGLIGGTRVSKSDIRLEAYGTVDELNAQIGVLISLELKDELKEFLLNIQNLLFTVGSNLATDTLRTEFRQASVMRDEFITSIEKEIDRLDQNLPPLEQFILPGGSRVSAQCHVCRTVARRAERRIIEMNETYPVDSKLVIYVNRLSDFFFILARYLLKEDNMKEIFWKKPE